MLYVYQKSLKSGGFNQVIYKIMGCFWEVYIHIKSMWYSICVQSHSRSSKVKIKSRKTLCTCSEAPTGRIFAKFIVAWIVCTSTKFGERCFSHAGPAAWSSLPASIKLTTDTNRFKKLLKAHLFHIAFWHLLAPLDNL